MIDSLSFSFHMTIIYQVVQKIANNFLCNYNLFTNRCEEALEYFTSFCKVGQDHYFLQAVVCGKNTDNGFIILEFGDMYGLQRLIQCSS